MSNECFWDVESVVGLARRCTPADESGVLSFVPVPNVDQYLTADGGGYGAFALVTLSATLSAALEDNLYEATLTGVAYIKPYNGDGPSVMGELGTPLPPDVVFVVRTGDFGSVYGFDLAVLAVSGEAESFYYGRIDVGGVTFYGLFAVGAGV